MSHGENVMESNSKWQLRTLAYPASPTKSNKSEEKWQVRGEHFQAPKGSQLWEGDYMGEKSWSKVCFRFLWFFSGLIRVLSPKKKNLYPVFRQKRGRR